MSRIVKHHVPPHASQLILVGGVFVLFEICRWWFGWHLGYFGAVPGAVPWFGALGGALRALVSGSWHRGDERYGSWQGTDWLVGAFAGGIGCLLIGVLLGAAGGAGHGNPSFYDLAALVCGYCQDTLLRLLRKLADHADQRLGVSERPGAETPELRHAASPAAAGGDDEDLIGDEA